MNTNSNNDNSLSKKPKATPFNQQKMIPIFPRISIDGIIAIYFIIAIIFIPVGNQLLYDSSSIYEYSIQYDGSNTKSYYYNNCHINKSNKGKTCTITIEFTKDTSGPIYIYYELDNFYQNYRRYVKSISTDQLLGEMPSEEIVEQDCYPMTTNGSQLLYPCGLIANTMYNDVIELSDSSELAGYELDTDGITWYFDRHYKFHQVDGFVYAKIDNNNTASCAEALGSSYSDCKEYIDPITNHKYLFWYPNDKNIQYLYETYPNQISPINGVTDEHFINWMRLGGLSNFRKLYGKIDKNFNKNEKLSFNIINNYEVTSMNVKKSIVITNLYLFGGKNYIIGNVYRIIGIISLIIGFIFALKRIFIPRLIGDIREIKWSLQY